MRKRDSSGKGKGRRNSDSRSGQSAGGRRERPNTSRPKFNKRSSEMRDEEPGEKKPFSSRGKKSFGRTNERNEKGYTRGGANRFSESKRSERSFNRTSDREETPGDKKPYGSRGKKAFGRTNERSEKTYSRDKDSRFKGSARKGKSFDREEGKSEGGKSDKKGFFSKLSRGGKSYQRRHDTDFGKSVKTFTQDKQEQKEASSDKIRLNKYIANSGVCSRREADELITMGLVSVNGKVITELGYKIKRGDVVKYDGKTLRSEKPVYILMNKPKGYLTTTKDPQERNTVMHIIGGAVKERVYPVGRLDRNTTGLLLLTNDGDLTEKLSHPSYNVKKIYKVELDKPLSKTDFQKIIDGVQLEEGRTLVDDLAIVSEDGKTVGIELHIGWNRVVRRIFERLEYTVIKLDRTIYAGLDKKDLPRGHWRFLTPEEVVRLKHYK